MKDNRTLWIAATVSNPYVLFDETRQKWSGILINFLQASCYRLLFRCKFFATQDPGNHKVIDETLLGVFGEIINGTADAGISPVSITAKRFQNFSFIDSFLRRTFVAVIHENQLISAKPSEYMFHLLQSLVQDEVWIGLCCTTCFMVIFGSTYDIFTNNRKNNARSLFRITTKWVFRVIGTGLGIQGIEDFGEHGQCNSWPLSKMTLILTWTIYTFFILSTLIGALPSIFTLGVNQQLPFTNLQQLVDSDFITYSGTTLISSLNISKNSFHTRLARQMLILPDSTSTASKYERYVDLARNEKSVLLIDLDSLLEISYFNCEIIVAIDNFESVSVAGLVLPKDSPLQSLFEYGYSTIKDIGMAHLGIRDLGMFMSGAARRHEQNKDVFGCFRRKLTSVRTVTEHSLDLQTLQFLFWFFAGGLLVSFVTIVCELTFVKIIKSKLSYVL